MLSKKEQKVLKSIENKYREKFNREFVRLMLEHVPFDEKDAVNVKIPTKKKLLSLIENSLNSEKSLIISGMLNQFINERYEVIKK